MFAEYALLVGRMTRRLGSAASAPMTLSEGDSIAQQAQYVFFGYVNPILGHVRTTKVHRVLCHVLDAIKYHGNIMNANTSSNEKGHKDDKRHYLRKNKRTGDTRQLVRHAHGTRKGLRRNAAAKQEQVMVAAQDRGASVDGGYAADSEMVGAPLRRARTAHRKHERVGVLSARPGLSTLTLVLGVPERRRVAVTGHVFFHARLPQGSRRQVVRASASFHDTQWYDHVEYLSAGAAEGAAVQYGKARLIVRTADEVHRVIVAEMERVIGADECPLTTRGCTQLRWSTSGPDENGDARRLVTLRAVPSTDIVRVVHVVPDCADMGRRERNGVTPPSFDLGCERLWNMRYHLNAFHPDTEH